MKLHMMTHGQQNSPGPNKMSSGLGRLSPYSLAHRSSCSDSYFPSKSAYQRIGTTRSDSPVDLRQISTCAQNQQQPYPHLNSFSVMKSMQNQNIADDLLLVEEHIRPLIKEELRYTIQSKRIARGLPGTVEIEYKSPQPEDLSPETLVKRERRRERNKVAAAKCRFKKKIVSEKLQEESENLENINMKLKKEIQKLQEERQNLIYILNVHQPTCTLSDDLFSHLTENENKKQSNTTSKLLSGNSATLPSNDGANTDKKHFCLNLEASHEWQSSTSQENRVSIDSLLSTANEASSIQRTVTQSC